MVTPDELAAAFAGALKENLHPEEWVEMRRRNALPEYDGDVCASHDFCDANMVMASAFEAVVGREMIMDGGDSPEEQADQELWNEAWGIAADKYLTEKHMKILSNHPDNGEVETLLRRSTDEDLLAYETGRMYLVGDLIISGHDIGCMRPVFWNPTTQSWEEHKQ